MATNNIKIQKISERYISELQRNNGFVKKSMITFLVITGCMSIYIEHNTIGMMFNTKNPITWILILASMVMSMINVIKEHVAYAHEFKMKKDSITYVPLKIVMQIWKQPQDSDDIKQGN